LAADTILKPFEAIGIAGAAKKQEQAGNAEGGFKGIHSSVTDESTRGVHAQAEFHLTLEGGVQDHCPPRV